jgi:glycosyltransferase involved in cell wall biosynthesis
LVNQSGIEFIGEINERSKTKFLGDAVALLFPIDWPEPFGLVMIEAMACGTTDLLRSDTAHSLPPTRSGFLFARIFASYSKLQLTFINYLFARSALNAIPDCAARLPEQADNGVRAGPRSTR